MSRCTNGDEGKPAEKRRVTERKMDRGRRSRVGGGGMRGAQRELLENRIFFEIGDIMKMTGSEYLHQDAGECSGCKNSSDTTDHFHRHSEFIQLLNFNSSLEIDISNTHLYIFIFTVT